MVLRGVGRAETVLVKHGTDRGALLYIEGKSEVPGDTLCFISDNIPAGSTAISQKSLTSHLTPLTSRLRITIVRPCTWEWIDHLGMRDFGGGLDYTGWKPTDIELRWDRTIVDVRNDSLILDAPLTTSINQEFGGAYILMGRHEGEPVPARSEHGFQLLRQRPRHLVRLPLIEHKPPLKRRRKAHADFLCMRPFRPDALCEHSLHRVLDRS